MEVILRKEMKKMAIMMFVLSAVIAGVIFVVNTCNEIGGLQ